MMSVRLRLASWLSRRLAKPRVRRARDPDVVRADFLRHAARTHIAPPLTATINGRLGAIDALWVRCGPVRSPKIIFYVHGGGFVAGHPKTHFHVAAHLCQRLHCEAVMPVYRLAPEHPFPAGIDDVIAGYRALIESGRSPDDIVLVGDSAGGCLVMALLAWLSREQHAMPRAAVAISPVLDLTGQSPSLAENAKSESLLSADRFGDLMQMYLQGEPADGPLASPLFAQFDRLPPMLFHVCDGEILRDDTLRMQSRLIEQGHDPLVRSWPNSFHVFHILRGWVPEADEALNDVAKFITELR